MNVFTEIKARVSCVDVAKEYGIHLTKKGNHFLALCPFHAEKTPSFIIHPDHFYCFGCGIGGDAINLVEKLQGLHPVEAVREIVHRLSLSIELNQDMPTKPKKKKVYNQKDFLSAIEAWRDKTFPVYADWFKALDEIIKEMKPDMPYFQALVELRADLDAITSWQASDRFKDIYMAFLFVRGSIYEL
jgi:hypothetical protein